MDMSLSKLREVAMYREAGVLQSMRSQRVGHDWATELSWTDSSSLMFTFSSHLSGLEEGKAKTFHQFYLVPKYILSVFTSLSIREKLVNTRYYFTIANCSLLDCVLVTQSCLTLWDPMDCRYCQAPLSMEFSRQEYWRGLPFPSPTDCYYLGIEPGFPALRADSPGKPIVTA